MTEPEQWAVELFIAAVAQWWRQTDRSDYGPAALTIQRAFEERDRKLRGQLTFIQQSHDWMYGEKQRLENALKDIASRAHANLAQALKETPDAQ